MGFGGFGSAVSIFKRWDRPQRGCQLPLWVEIWLGISAILCTLDVIYTMLRPLTNRGGDLECVYELWNWYADVDLRYATANDLVTMATGRCMIIEIVMNLVAMFMNRSGSKHTLITAFTTNAFVFWKTVIYMALYISPAEGNPSFINPTASKFDIIVYFWIPDGLWLLLPFIVLIRLWGELLVYPPGTLPEHTPTNNGYSYVLQKTSTSNIIAGDDDTSTTSVGARLVAT